MRERAPPSAAASIYPHLPRDAGQPPQRQQPSSVAEAMWPPLTLKPPQPAPQLTPEQKAREAAHFWASVRAGAAPVPAGFVKVGRR
jgi:hypothetical protein